MEKEVATFAAGCFWGVEAAFRKIEGVIDAESGYTGGDLANPRYEDVCSGTTGHAEAVRVTFDPGKVSYAKLLEAFWKMHDPTQVNAQGPDIGEQYRSAIFYYTNEQKEAAEQSKGALQKSSAYKKPIATEITEAGPFYRAEEYHQRYFEKNGGGTCHI